MGVDRIALFVSQKISCLVSRDKQRYKKINSLFSFLLLATFFSTAYAADHSYNNITQGSIPDGQSTCASVLTRTINVPDSFLVGDVNVGIVIDHAYRSDLVLTLTSPTGDSVEIINGVPSITDNAADDFNVLLDSGTAISLGQSNIHDAFANYPQYTRVPTVVLNGNLNVVSLDPFNYKAANGTWTLSMCDKFAPDAGTFLRFQLDFIEFDPVGGTAASCTDPIEFTWEGAGRGNQAVWPAGATNFSSMVDNIMVTVNVADPNDVYNKIDSKSNGVYGPGYITLYMDNDDGGGTPATTGAPNNPYNSGDKIVVQYSFSVPVDIDDWRIDDIDASDISNPPDGASSFQDQIQLLASRGGVNIVLSTRKDAGSLVNLSGQNAISPWIAGTNLNVSPDHIDGQAFWSTSSYVDFLQVEYIAGASELNPAQQAVRMPGFLFCPVYTVSGNVSDDAGDPLSGVTITLIDSNNVVTETVTTDASGNYRLETIQTGTYTIRETDPANYSSVSDTDGGDTNSITLIASKGTYQYPNNNFVDKTSVFLPGIVSGSVKDTAANAISGVTVEIRNVADNSIRIALAMSLRVIMSLLKLTQPVLPQPQMVIVQTMVI